MDTYCTIPLESGQTLSIPADLSVSTARLPHAYTAAKTALANCASIDECKEWSDRMQALASYARQADDETLLKMVQRIQGRAVRRCGELLKQFDGRGDHRKSGGSPTSCPTQRQAAEDAGLSKDQQVTAVRVANVPIEDFERQIEADRPPTVTALAHQGTKPNGKPSFVPPEGFEEATRLLGTIRRFSEFCDANDPERVARGLLEHETGQAKHMVGVIDAWLDLFVVNLMGNNR